MPNRWNSISEVVAEFELKSQTDDFDGLLAELKAKRSELHPDKTGGSFTSIGASDRYHSMDEAMSFVSDRRQPAGGLVPVSQLSELVKASLETALAPVRAVEASSQRSELLIDVGRRISSRYTVPRFSSAILGAIFVGIITFSDKLKDNPILAPLMRHAAYPYLIWVALVACGICFSGTWLRERDEKNRAELLTSETGFLEAFRSFCQYPLSHRDTQEGLPILQFGKLEYAESLRDDAQFWHRNRILRTLGNLYRPSSILSPLSAERLAEIHLRRLLERKIIRASNQISLDEGFEIDLNMVRKISGRA